jgi:tetratricopeptide (TPR) repeat protein
MEGLPERFRALRKQRRLSSSALADPRYSVSYVSQIERGHRRPSQEALEYFARRLGVSPDFLRTGVPDDLPKRLRYELEEAERDLSEGSFAQARERAEQARSEAAPFELAAVQQTAACIVADALYREGEQSQAARAYERLLGQDLPRSLRVRAVAGLARSSRAVGDLKYAAQVIEGFMGEDHDPPLDHAAVAELQSVLVSIYFERGDVVLAQRAAERALDASDESVPIRTRAVARWHASRVEADRREWDEALSLAHDARMLIEQLHNRRDTAKLHTAYAFLCLEAEPPRVEEALEHLEPAERLLSDLGGGPDLAYVYTERGRAALAQERFEEAVADAERAAGTEGVFVLERGRALLLRGRALRRLGQADEAKGAIQEALAIFEENDARQQAVLCWRELGEMAQDAGDFETATKAFRTGVELSGGGRASLIF